MVLTLGVWVYTVRMVLKILGVEDYGIYNVVGGTVSLLSFVVNSMASASQRYLSFELGSGDHGALKGIFNLSVSRGFSIFDKYLSTISLADGGNVL